MENIFDSINGLIVKTYGGLLAFWIAAGYVFMKFLNFLGGCLAEGAINKGIAKIMPIVKSEFKTEFDSLRADLLGMKTDINAYKKRKHDVESENGHLKEAILLNDENLLKELRNSLKREQNEKKQD